MKRRDFVVSSAAALPLARRFRPLARRSWPGYAKATVIDCLASPGPFNSPDSGTGPLTDEMVANARASGLTAVNPTLERRRAGSRQLR